MTSSFIRQPFHRMAVRLGAAGVAAIACLLVAGCGGDESTAQEPAGTTAQNNAAPLGAGGVSEEVPIVVAPAPGPCAATGTAAIQSPLLNSQLDCAP